MPARLLCSQDARAGMPTTRFVEFVGTVVDANTLREESNSNWGDNFGKKDRATVPMQPAGLHLICPCLTFADLGMHNECLNLMNSKYAVMFQA